MNQMLKRYLSTVPKGYKKYLRDLYIDPIAPSKLVVDELRHLSAELGLPINMNSLENVQKYWFQKDAPYREVDVEILAKSKINGDGIGYLEETGSFVTVPFTVVGDVVRAKLKRHYEFHAESELVLLISKSRKRIDAPCSHFTNCSGCQLQNMPYEDQLHLKRDIIRFAFKNAFGGSNKFDPIIDSTMPSPLRLHYRTKLTPHYDDTGAVGLNSSKNRSVVDLQSCHLATDLVNRGFASERDRIAASSSKMGTLVIRESLNLENDEWFHATGERDSIVELVNGYKFEFPVYTFFQNNRSILPSLLGYISSKLDNTPEVSHLVDTYCGSGFFAISLSARFKDVYGIEISEKSIESARENVKLNGLSNVNFVSGTASEIFSEISHLPPEKTCVLMDPSRKGSTGEFLQQLASFRPKSIVYVSCNVYSQARDLSMFLQKFGMDSVYNVVEIKGFDFFPQTKHVESVAILQLK